MASEPNEPQPEQGTPPVPDRANEKPDLYISSLRVIGFRALDDATFNFQPNLNVLIGANNSGKTAVIDALRIILNLGSFQEKEDMIRLRPSDICRSAECSDTATVQFEATFHGKDNADIAAQFLEMDANSPAEEGYRVYRLRYKVQFKRPGPEGEYRYATGQVTGGESYQNPVPNETLDYIKSIYLAPLRDVTSDGARLGREIDRLIQGHGDPAALRAIPGAVREKAEELISAATRNGHEKSAGKTLAKYASPYGIAESSLKFIPAGLSDDMLRGLQIVFSHGYHGSGGLGLGSKGLGINNLIYASVVLSRNGADGSTPARRFLLIEEPEAHLHPQSQETFFRELNEVSAQQIFVTSHSPTITAKCDLDKVIVMGHPCESRKHQPCHLSEILAGKEADKRYLHKFLDVTRSQLLFANGAVFVEGVTEAMLLQAFSEAMGCDLRARGVEIVALGSNGGFGHFRGLFGDGGLGVRCAFLTDGDQAPTDLPSDKDELLQLSASATFEADGAVRTYRGLGTFEFELLLAAASQEDPWMRGALAGAMEEARDAAAAGVNEAFRGDFMDFEDPALAYAKMKQKKADQFVKAANWRGDAQTNGEFVGRKSEFAYLFLQRLAARGNNPVTVPAYIAHAVRYVAQGEQAPGPTGTATPEPAHAEPAP